MNRLLLLTSVCALMGAGIAGSGPATAQDLPWNTPGATTQVQAPQPVPAPGPPIAPQVTGGAQVPVTAQGQPTAAVVPQQIVYAVKNANIRSGPGKQYNAIGKIPAGEGVAVVGGVPGDPHWVQLASGGYVFASSLSPTPPVIVHHHAPPLVVPPPSNAYYPVGTCQPYSRVVNIGGQPSQINGTACKQVDGTWRIENYAPVPVQATAPVVVAPPPVVYAAPPVVYAPPVVVERGYGHYGPGPYGPYGRY